MMGGSLSEGYFDRLYESSEDPWGFATSLYEHRKYDRTMSALGGRHFDRAFEVGCSIGVFTSKLATVCQEVVGVDISETALALARRRLVSVDHVRLVKMQVPEESPEGSFDLVVCSEVLYYWSPETLSKGIRLLQGLTRPGGLLVAVHWRPRTRTYPMQGDDVHEMLRSELSWKLIDQHVETRFRLEAFEAPHDVGAR